MQWQGIVLPWYVTIILIFNIQAHSSCCPVNSSSLGQCIHNQYLPIQGLFFTLPQDLNMIVDNSASGIHLAYGLWAQITNFLKIFVALMWKRMIQSGHNFAHAMTAQLSWHVQNCDLIGWLESKLWQKKFAQKFRYELINIWWNGCLICQTIQAKLPMKSAGLFGHYRTILSANHIGEESFWSW